jgi:hypothetical protein
MNTLAHPSPLVEYGYARPAMASRLSGFRPYELRNLIIDDAHLVRTVHAGGRLLIHLNDLLLIAQAPAEGRRTP